MRVVDDIDDSVVDCLQRGGVVVLRTDTLYGIVTRADNQAAVQRVYDIKGRDDTKPSIVLIASHEQLFDELRDAFHQIVDTYWPGPVSIVLPSVHAQQWITRGTGTVAYRLPADDRLRTLIAQAGPLIAPSANPQGQPPATTVQQAIGYFADTVDTYVDGGEVSDLTPSQLLRVDDHGEVERLR